MKALTFHGLEKVQYDNVPEPELSAPEDAIVKVTMTAICGSDLHVYHGREPGLDPGTTMGHEFIGEVVAIGEKVRARCIGDRVVSPFTTNCGHCFYCRMGLTCRCEKGQLFGWVERGQGLQGAQAEYVRVPFADEVLLRLPERALAEEALLLGDILTTGYFCAHNASIASGGTYVVVGCGPVGLMAVIGARELGAERVFAVDALPERLEKARALGAVPINYRQDDPRALLWDANEGRGADAVLEAVGNPSAQRLAINLVRPGGVISVAGVHHASHFAFSPGEAYDKNLTYKVGRSPARYYMDRLLPLVLQREYDLSSIISHRLPLSEGAHGYHIFAGRLEQCTKVVLKP